MRILALALVLFTLPPAFAEEPEALREYSKLHAEYRQAWAVQMKKVRKAGTDPEFKALAETNPDRLFTPRFLALAEKHSAAPAAALAALQVLRSASSEQSKLHERALSLVLKHAGSKYLTPHIPTLSSQEGWSIQVLREIVKKHQDPKAQARAGRVLRQYLEDAVEKGTEANLDGEFREKLEKQTTPNYVADLIKRLHDNRKELRELVELMGSKLAKDLPKFEVGLPIPDLTVTDLDGKQHALRKFPGKLLLINVFSIERNQPHWLFYSQQSEYFKDRPVVRINICIDERREMFTDWLRHLPMQDITVWAGRDSECFAEWSADHQREQTYLVGPDGVMRHRSPAVKEEPGTLTQKMEELFAQMNVPAWKAPAAPKVKADGLTETARAYEQLRLDFQYGNRAYERTMLLARNDDDKRKAYELVNWQTFGTRALELAEKHLDDPASFDLLSFRVRHFANTSEDEYAHAVMLLGKHHAASPRMIELIRPAARGVIGQPLFLRKILEKNPDRAIQARASRILKEYYETQAGAAEHYLQANPELQRAIRRRSGEAHINELLDSMKANQEQRAKYVKLYNEKYAKVLPEIVVGKPMLDARLTGLDGKKFKLSDLRGKIVHLNVFSAQEHRPLFWHQRQFADRVKGKPFVVVNVSVDERKETFEEYLRRDPTPAVNAWVGRRSELYADWMPGGYHSTYLIDSKGILRSRSVHWGDLPDTADELLAELKDGKRVP